MWFIGVEVEQETSAPLPKKILDPPLHALVFVRLKRETDPDLLIFFQDIYASKL